MPQVDCRFVEQTTVVTTFHRYAAELNNCDLLGFVGTLVHVVQRTNGAVNGKVTILIN
jgi:hypothetical protein